MHNESSVVFPFGPMIYKTTVDDDLCDKIISWIESQENPDHMAAFNLTGQITNEYGIPSVKFPELEKIINDHTLNYLEEMLKNNRRGTLLGITIKYMWANKMQKYDWNPPHIHSQSFSGVLYLHDWNPETRHPKYKNKAPGGVTVFHDGRHADWSSYEHIENPKKGVLLMFPAWLLHSVGPSWNDGQTRYTVSWNI